MENIKKFLKLTPRKIVNTAFISILFLFIPFIQFGGCDATYIRNAPTSATLHCPIERSVSLFGVITNKGYGITFQPIDLIYVFAAVCIIYLSSCIGTAIVELLRSRIIKA